MSVMSRLAGGVPSGKSISGLSSAIRWLLAWSMGCVLAPPTLSGGPYGPRHRIRPARGIRRRSGAALADVDGSEGRGGRVHLGAMRIRIGIDTGGTFTDVVALDEATGEMATSKTPSTPADPAEGFMAAVHKALSLVGAAGPDVAAVSHGTTVATNQLIEDRIGDIGFVTTEGFEFMLEIARQSVPDGYGNSYFWVKPPRIVPVHRVRTVGGRLDHTGAELRPFDEAGAVEAARWFRDRGVTTIGVCFLHSYADPRHELRMAEVL